MKKPVFLLCCAIVVARLTPDTHGQVPAPTPVSKSTVVAVSPDGGTLAIARSSQDVRERNGHVELWDIKTGRFLRSITGFDGTVSFMSFDPDGQALVTASFEIHDSKIQSKPKDRDQKIVTEIKWWDVASGEFKRKIPLEGPADMETIVSPNGNMIAVIKRYLESGLVGVYMQRVDRTANARRSRSLLETLEVRAVDTGTGETKFKTSVNSVFFTAFQGSQLAQSKFSADGRLLAVASADEVKVWDISSGNKLQTLKKLSGTPLATAFSPDSHVIAVASGKLAKDTETIQETEITVWDLATGKLIRNLRGKSDVVSALHFASNGQALLFGTLEYGSDHSVGTVKVWDFTTNRLATFNVHDDQAVSFVDLLTGQSALVLQSGEDVEIRDTRTWTTLHSFTPKEDDSLSKGANRFVLSVKQVAAIGFSSDGISVSGILPDEGVRVWDSRTGGVTKHIKEVNDPDALVARSSNGRFVGELQRNELRIWDLTTGTRESHSVGDSAKPSAFALSPDGKVFAWAVGSTIKLRSIGDNSTIKLDGHADAVVHIVFSDNDRTLVSCDDSGSLKLWDASTGQLQQSIATGGAVTALAIDPQGQLAATAGSDYLISLWAVRSGTLQSKLRKHENTVNALAFSSDGRMLASGGDDRTAVIWDVASSRSKQTLKGHDLTVSSLAFSPDGRFLASGSGNATVVLWNVNNGKLERILR